MTTRGNLLTCLVIVGMMQSLVAGRDLPAVRKSGDREQKLIEVLQSAATPQKKAVSCKQLAVSGTGKSVQALAPLLTDKALASWARIALEAIPDSAADDALRQALDRLQGNLLVGVINSIGVRGDVKSVGALMRRLAEDDDQVASAAAVALGRIGGEQAAHSLLSFLSRAPQAVRSEVAKGCILCAEKDQSEGKQAEAVRIYDVIRAADVPKQRILHATRGAILARGADGIPLLAEQLRAVDKARFAVGLRVARELSGSTVTDLLAAALSQAKPDRQALLILALADRGDAAISPPVLKAAQDGADNVRIAAIRMLQRHGDAAHVPILLDAATSDDTGVSNAAVTALAAMPGKEVDRAILTRLPTAVGKIRPILIVVSGQRRCAEALPALLTDVEDPDGQVRAASLEALGSLASLRELPVLIQQVVTPRGQEDAAAAEAALRTACTRMPDREVCAEKLIAALPQSELVARRRLLGILGELGGDKALQALAVASKDPHAEIQDVASYALGQWMSSDAVPALLDMARTACADKYRVRALRGYIRVARQLKLPADQRLAMFRTAMKTARRNEEKRIALEILIRVPSAATLQIAASYLGDPSLKDTAASIAVRVAAKVADAQPDAVAEILKKVVAAGVNADTGARARKLLEQIRPSSSAR